MSREHPSRLQLEQHRLHASVQVSAHVDSCSRCSARIALMERDDRSFLQQNPFRAHAAVPVPAPWFRKRWFAGIAIAAPALAIVLLLVLAKPSDTIVSETTRSKGATIVELAVQRNGESFDFNGEPLRSGDILAFRYTSDREYLLVISVESSGRIEPIIATDAHSVAISPGHNIVLDLGIELDDYPDPERIIALFSRNQLSFEDIRKVIEQELDRVTGLETMPWLPLDADQLSWRIEKESE